MVSMFNHMLGLSHEKLWQVEHLPNEVKIQYDAAVLSTDCISQLNLLFLRIITIIISIIFKVA